MYRRRRVGVKTMLFAAIISSSCGSSEIRAVLDGVDADFDSHTQAGAAERVAHDAPAALVRFIDQCLKLARSNSTSLGA